MPRSASLDRSQHRLHENHDQIPIYSLCQQRVATVQQRAEKKPGTTRPRREQREFMILHPSQSDHSWRIYPKQPSGRLTTFNWFSAVCMPVYVYRWICLCLHRYVCVFVNTCVSRKDFYVSLIKSLSLSLLRASQSAAFLCVIGWQSGHKHSHMQTAHTSSKVDSPHNRHISSQRSASPFCPLLPHTTRT